MRKGAGRMALKSVRNSMLIELCKFYKQKY